MEYCGLAAVHDPVPVSRTRDRRSGGDGSSWRRDGGDEAPCATNQKSRYVLSLSEQEPETSANLFFVNIGGEDSFLKGRVIHFSKEEPLYQIDYQESYQTEEDRNRVLMEMGRNGAGAGRALHDARGCRAV